jgi:hypothetical protein
VSNLKGTVDKDVTALLLDAALRVAPYDRDVHRGFSEGIYSQMYIDGATDKEVAIALMQSMLDGLQYGNWPVPERKGN